MTFLILACLFYFSYYWLVMRKKINFVDQFDTEKGSTHHSHRSISSVRGSVAQAPGLAVAEEEKQ